MTTTDTHEHTHDHNDQQPTFEQAFDDLQVIVQRLESGELPLDEAVSLYERGQALARLCGELLDAAELRVQQVAEDGGIAPLDA